MAYTFSHLPHEFLTVLSIITGTYALYSASNAGTNKIALFSVVFWLYGLGLYGVFEYFQILQSIQFEFFVAVNSIFLVWLLFGYIVLFLKGTDEQRNKIKQVPIQLFSLLIQGILLLALITIFFKWIKPLF